MIEGQLWAKIRDYSKVLHWIRVDTVTPPGFSDAVGVCLSGIVLMELKVGTCWSEQLDLRDSQLRFNKTLKGKTTALFHLKYNYVAEEARLTQIYTKDGEERTWSFYKTSWKDLVYTIENTIYESLK